MNHHHLTIVFTARGRNNGRKGKGRKKKENLGIKLGCVGGGGGKKSEKLGRGH